MSSMLWLIVMLSQNSFDGWYHNKQIKLIMIAFQNVYLCQGKMYVFFVVE
jgi:hypothetical protein